MKRFALTALAAGLLVLSGCVGTTALGVWDDSVPQEMQCPLEIRNSLSVIVYDNQPVEWSPQYVEDSKVSISLPPGRHTFIIPYYESAENITVLLTATIRQEFLPGHSYRIYEQKFWLLFFTVTNIKIKDVTPKDRK